MIKKFLLINHNGMLRNNLSRDSENAVELTNLHFAVLSTNHLKMFKFDLCMWFRMPVIFALIILCFCFTVKAQHHVPLHFEVSQQIEKVAVKENLPINLNYKPFLNQQLHRWITPDTLLLDHLDTPSTKSWFYRKLRTEHLAEVNTPNFQLNLDVLFDFRYGSERETGKTIYRNTRAAKLEGRLGKNITFFSKFYENQASFPSYIDSTIRESWIVPGQGVKRDFRETGFDFNWAEGGFLWVPARNLQFQLAHGKTFIGNGYRSLLLSDAAFGYPHLSVNYVRDNLKYVKSFAPLMHNIHNVNTGNYLFDRKFLGWHYLNFNFLKGDVQIALFEANMWATPDSTGKFDFNPAYLNPVPIITSLFKNNNSVLGLNISANVFNTMQFYGQFVLDDQVGENSGFTKANTGFQLGYKYFDFFNLDGLFLLLEYNQVMPYTFAHNNSLVSYSHYNQPLAHPLGANFREGIIKLSYQYKSLRLKSQVNLITYGDETNPTGAKDILQPVPDRNNLTQNFLKGTETHIQVFGGEIQYILNPLTQMNISIGYHTRNFSQSNYSSSSSTIFAAFRTSLTNFYYDY